MKNCPQYHSTSLIMIADNPFTVITLSIMFNTIGSQFPGEVSFPANLYSLASPSLSQPRAEKGQWKIFWKVYSGYRTVFKLGMIYYPTGSRTHNLKSFIFPVSRSHVHKLAPPRPDRWFVA